MSFSFAYLASARAAVIACAWLLAVGAGSAALLRYERAPGESGIETTRWPEESSLPRPSGRPTMLVFAHPKCPCTGATLGELEGLLQGAAAKAAVTVVFARAAVADAEWDDTALSRRAQSIPGVTVARDLDGIEAQRFGAKTSGFTVLYSGEGELLFRGGITDGRGHAGDNIGRRSVTAFLNGGRTGATRTHVFGCPLFATP